VSFLAPTIISAGLLGLALNVGAADHQGSAAEGFLAPAAESIYTEAHGAAAALRGASAVTAAGQPVSLEFVTSLLRAASFGFARSAPEEWTLFLPIDAAFSAIAGAQLDALIHDRTALEAMLDAHIADGLLTTEDMRNGTGATTLDGEELRPVFAHGLRVNDANVLAEKAVGNGRVFIIDRLL
jgi:uncharacterized surface protein with fasciclin (FAS1) repeats